MEDLDLKKDRAEPPDSEDDETGSICPSMESNSSIDIPPDFSNEPEPSDPKDLIQRRRAKQEKFFRRPRVKVRAPRRSTMFLDLIQRLRAKQEKFFRRRGLKELLRRPRQREQEELLRQREQEFSWFLSMMSPWSARKPPDFSTEPEPSDSEDQNLRLRAEPPGSVCPAMRSDRSKDIPPDFSNEPEPSDRKF